MKTHGVLKYGTGAHGDKAWGLEVTPNVAIRAKRVFPKTYQGRTGVIVLTDTPENALELEWFLQRFPLEAEQPVLDYLHSRADEHREQTARIEAVFADNAALAETWPRNPAREPRQYQRQAVAMMRVTKRMLLADDVGLGKSFSSLLLLLDPETLPALVVTLTHLPTQWLSELEASLPWLNGYALKTGKPTDKVIAQVGEAQVIVSNYHKLNGWRDHLSGQVRTVIFDEVQELRHTGTDKYDAAAQIADKADYVVGLSATPIHNYGGEMHNVMEAIRPGGLGNRTEFLREWCGMGSAGKSIVANPRALGQHLRDEGVLLRRTRKDVHRELPEPQQIEHEVPHNRDAIDAVSYDVAAMAALVLDTDASKQDRWQAAGELDWKMRLATGVAKAPYVAEFVRLLLESEEKVVLYGWHRDVYAIWLSMLADFRPVMYTGSESPSQKNAAFERFTKDPHSRVFICSLRSGAGLDGLQDVSSVCVFGELDWSPNVHWQAIGRLARDGQENTVIAYYLTTDVGSDPVISDVLDIKRMQSMPMMDPDKELFATAKPDVNRIRLLAEQVLNRAMSDADDLLTDPPTIATEGQTEEQGTATEEDPGATEQGD